MADLTKLFVLVPANLDVQVDAVKAKSLETGNTQKVYFVEVIETFKTDAKYI